MISKKTAIELINVNKIYPNGTLANKNININIKYGQIHSLLGENGAGKTTLVKILTGSTKITSGKIKINGKRITNYDYTLAKDYKFAVVHQHFSLINNFSVFENVILGNELKKPEKLKKIEEDYLKEKDQLFNWAKKNKKDPEVDRKFHDKLASLQSFYQNQKTLFWCYQKDLRQRVQDTIDKFKLKINIDQLIHEVSVSKKQKTEILKVLFRQAKIIIFDEPTSVISEDEIAIFLETLKIFRDQGKAIIFISHKLDEIKEISDQITILRKGEIVGHFENKNIGKNLLINLLVGKQKLKPIVDIKRNPVINETLLEIKDLSLNLENQPILKNINFKINRGEIIAIAGIEDNGQKELLEIIAGIEKKYTGKIKYLKLDNFNSLNAKEIKRSGIAYIPQDRHSEGLLLTEPLTTNVFFNNWNDPTFFKSGFWNRKNIEERTEKIITKYQVHGVRSIYEPASNLSGGNQQKFIIGRELESLPELLLIHEPTWGIDIGTINYLNHLFLEKRNEGKSILFTSSDLGQAVSLADRIIVLSKGQIKGEVNPSESDVFKKIGKLMTSKSKEVVKPKEKS